MKKLVLLAVLFSVFSCNKEEAVEELDICGCYEVTYKIVPNGSSTHGQIYTSVEVSRSKVDCQDEKRVTEGKMIYSVECTGF